MHATAGELIVRRPVLQPELPFRVPQNIAQNKQDMNELVRWRCPTFCGEKSVIFADGPKILGERDVVSRLIVIIATPIAVRLGHPFKLSQIAFDHDDQD